MMRTMSVLHYLSKHYKYLHIHSNACMPTCLNMYACINVGMYVCMYVGMYVSV